MSFISSVASLWPELVIRTPGSGSCSGRTGRTINKSAYAGANLQLVMINSKPDIEWSLQWGQVLKCTF
ncbi:hypothetical protein A3860_14610 [Niastella vici]|uniref:Uncharacterized protein n=1 Tax=Niastella vici TaxID=1703345 RepID=A0A1V9G5B1_9BACT|nr:hypothetical protein A3860_14610 [Niastella vici]